MGVTMCCGTALDVIRELRNRGEVLSDMNRVVLRSPTPWAHDRWTKREFDSDAWVWYRPSRTLPLDVFVPTNADRLRMRDVNSYECATKLPPESIIWLDATASVVCPELLFVQMASRLSLPAAVMLGHELCGHFSRDVQNPLFGDVRMGLPAATTVGQIASYIDALGRYRGVRQARRVLSYVADHALSAPEAVLSTVCSLPVCESGYGVGAVTLNKRIIVKEDSTDEEVTKAKAQRSRYPDLLFSFAPVGINYDGQEHLDLDGLVRTARQEVPLSGEELFAAKLKTDAFALKIRDKAVDDIHRNNELMSRGYAVMVATKEDLESGKALDAFMQRLLECAHYTFGTNITKLIKYLDDTSKADDRASLLSQIYPQSSSVQPQRRTF